MVSDSSNTTSTDNAGDSGHKRRINLKWMMPRAGFRWPDRPHVSTRIAIDDKIQDAMRTEGVPDFRFQRYPVVTLLVEALEALTTAVACNDLTLTDTDMRVVMITAVTVAQAQVAWLNKLSIEVILDLVWELLGARRDYVRATTVEQWEADVDRHAGTNAQRLYDAIDDFNCEIAKLGIRYNWAGETDAQHMARIAGEMSLGDPGVGLELPTLQLVNGPRPRPPLTADEARRMSAAWALAAAEEEEERRMIADWEDGDSDQDVAGHEDQEDDEDEAVDGNEMDIDLK